MRLLIAVLLIGHESLQGQTPKVFVTGGNSWQVTGSAGDAQVSGVGGSTVAEGIKLFREKCSAVELNMLRDRADYIVAVSDDGSGAGRKGRRAIVFRPDGQLIFANSARSLSNAVKDACAAMSKDWAARGHHDDKNQAPRN